MSLGNASVSAFFVVVSLLGHYFDFEWSYYDIYTFKYFFYNLWRILLTVLICYSFVNAGKIVISWFGNTHQRGKGSDFFVEFVLGITLVNILVVLLAWVGFAYRLTCIFLIGLLLYKERLVPEVFRHLWDCIGNCRSHRKISATAYFLLQLAVDLLVVLVFIAIFLNFATTPGFINHEESDGYVRFFMNTISNGGVWPISDILHFFISKGAGLHFLFTAVVGTQSSQLASYVALVFSALIVRRIITECYNNAFIGSLSCIIYSVVTAGGFLFSKTHIVQCSLFVFLVYFFVLGFRRIVKNEGGGRVILLGVASTTTSLVLLQPFSIVFIFSFCFVLLCLKPIHTSPFLRKLFTISIASGSVTFILIIVINFVSTGAIDISIACLDKFIDGSRFNPWLCFLDFFRLHAPGDGVFQNESKSIISYLLLIGQSFAYSSVFSPQYLPVSVALCSCFIQMIHLSRRAEHTPFEWYISASISVGLIIFLILFGIFSHGALKRVFFVANFFYLMSLLQSAYLVSKCAHSCLCFFHVRLKTFIKINCPVRATLILQLLCAFFVVVQVGPLFSTVCVPGNVQASFFLKGTFEQAAATRSGAVENISSLLREHANDKILTLTYAFPLWELPRKNIVRITDKDVVENLSSIFSCDVIESLNTLKRLDIFYFYLSSKSESLTPACYLPIFSVENIKKYVFVAFDSPSVIGDHGMLLTIDPQRGRELSVNEIETIYSTFKSRPIAFSGSFLRSDCLCSPRECRYPEDALDCDKFAKVVSQFVNPGESILLDKNTFNCINSPLGQFMSSSHLFFPHSSANNELFLNVVSYKGDMFRGFYKNSKEIVQSLGKPVAEVHFSQGRISKHLLQLAPVPVINSDHFETILGSLPQDFYPAVRNFYNIALSSHFGDTVTPVNSNKMAGFDYEIVNSAEPKPQNIQAIIHYRNEFVGDKFLVNAQFDDEPAIPVLDSHEPIPQKEEGGFLSCIWQMVRYKPYSKLVLHFSMLSAIQPSNQNDLNLTTVGFHDLIIKSSTVKGNFFVPDSLAFGTKTVNLDTVLSDINPENNVVRQWRWSRGPRSTISFELPEEQDLSISFAFNNPLTGQRVTLTANDIQIWRSNPISAQIWMDGEVAETVHFRGVKGYNKLEFSFDRWNGFPVFFSESDKTPYAVAFTRLKINGMH